MNLRGRFLVLGCLMLLVSGASLVKASTAQDSFPTEGGASAVPTVQAIQAVGAVQEAPDLRERALRERALREKGYQVQGVQVDITAKSAFEARTQAFQKAKEEGFRKLLTQLLSPEDRSKVQPPEDLEEYVRDLEVFGEKLSRVRYLASFTVRFHVARINSLFARQGVSPRLQTVDSAQASLEKSQEVKPVLLIPVLVPKDGHPLLWDEENAWYHIWSRAEEAPSFVVPVGDLRDIKDLSAEEARAGAVDKIARLLERYGLEQGLVTLLDLRQSEAPRLEVFHYSKDGLLRKSAWPLQAPSENLQEKATPEEEAVMRHAETQVRGLLKSIVQNFEVFAKLSDVRVEVLFSSLKEWHWIRDKLEALPVVKEVTVQSLRRTGADLCAKIIGDVEGVTLLLKGQELDVETDPQEKGKLVLQRAHASSFLPPSPPPHSTNTPFSSTSTRVPFPSIGTGAFSPSPGTRGKKDGKAGRVERIENVERVERAGEVGRDGHL